MGHLYEKIAYSYIVTVNTRYGVSGSMVPIYNHTTKEHMRSLSTYDTGTYIADTRIIHIRYVTNARNALGMRYWSLVIHGHEEKTSLSEQRGFGSWEFAGDRTQNPNPNQSRISQCQHTLLNP